MTGEADPAGSVRLNLDAQFHRWAYRIVRERGIPWLRVGPVDPPHQWYILFPDREAYEAATAAWDEAVGSA